MKRITIPLAVGTLVLAVAGCGGGDGNGDSSGGAATDVSSVADHDALVELANKEGALKVSTSFTEDSIPKVVEGFNKLYPDIELEINEQTGDDDQRILLEVQAEQSDLDVLHLSAESYVDYLPYVEDTVDILKLVQDGVLDIPEEMINPDHPSTLAVGSGIGAFSYNPELISADDVPQSWEDFLEPDFAGRKFLLDIEPSNLTCMTPLWGEEKTLEYATALGEQEPIWVRGDTNSLTQMAAGEYALHAFSNYHSAFRVSTKSDNIEIVVLDPVPVRITQIEAIRADAENPAAALLFLEYTASAEVQQILDEDEPRQSSIYAEGSELNVLTEGKEVSVCDWSTFDKFADWEEAIVSAWGFPTAEVKED